MRTPCLVKLLPVVLAFAACSTDTGLLINTSADETLAPSIESLRFYVGQDTIGDPLYFSDNTPADDIFLEGRDISEDPYKMLIRPSSESTDVMVAVVAYDGEGQGIGFGRLAEPVGFLSDKVLEWDVEISAFDADVFESANDCLKWRDEAGNLVHIGRAGDEDCDGHTVEEGDCDDLDPRRFPGQRENCNNNIDDDCNGFADAEDLADGDNDGFFVCGDEGTRDCNNNDETVHPGAAERCNGVDDDCNGICDDGFDVDGDLITSPCGSILGDDGQCIEMGDPDCADEDPEVFPGNHEICDGKDNDCNGTCDDDSSLDPDQDHFTECGSVVGECGAFDDLVDCEPDNPNVHPGEQELCDGVDQDCVEGNEPERSPCFTKDSGDCHEGVRACADGGLVGECLIDPIETLDSSFCDSYEQCELPGDPLACVLAGMGISLQGNENCQVVIGGDAQCEQNIVRIVPPNTIPTQAICTFTLVGGEQQQGYALQLLSAATGTPAVSIDSCDALLQVTPLVGAGDATIAINLQVVGENEQLIGVKLRARRLEACEARKGLECETWDNVNAPL